ncbi:uncharacterized protein LOC110615789 isoform X2 [Manihot esculenta]|uniref:uncharacterized protein LOC110615789 isoform X2 n=1 Tax=Manihot esculenta TaxID=3983 RepID=UPI000B5D17AE|nr:uncharacterized protein LOC110615789 isoform X2 [Manihot esculenta]
MQGDEARILLGFPPNSRPTLSQVINFSSLSSLIDGWWVRLGILIHFAFGFVKAAYRKKVWESHPDLFPFDEKPMAESRFKLMSEAYTYLLSGARWTHSTSATYTRVVRTGMPRAHGGRSNQALIRLPFFFIILGTVGLGGLNATRAYKKQKETYPSHNPFLP